MRKEFANFDLVKLLEVIEAVLTPVTKFTISRTIYYQDVPPKLRVEYQNTATNEEDDLVFDREFINTSKGIEIIHHYCIVPKDEQGKGLIKTVFQASLQEYVNMGAIKIYVHAGLTGGGHVWARHGFVAVNQSEVKTILDAAKGKLSRTDFGIVKSVYDKYYKDFPDGRAFPMLIWSKIDAMKEVLRGSDWHGELDLKNSEQFSNFKDYVFRK